MTHRDNIRTAIVSALDGFDEGDGFEISELKNQILERFDADANVLKPSDLHGFFASLESDFPTAEWSLLSDIVDVHASNVTENLTRQTLPELEIEIAHDGSSVEHGKTRIGGNPEWIQTPSNSEESPICENCDQIMAFLFQLDSLKLQGYQFMDAGNFYLFGCIICGTTSSSFQSH